MHVVAKRGPQDSHAHASILPTLQSAQYFIECFEINRLAEVMIEACRAGCLRVLLSSEARQGDQNEMASWR